MFKYSYSFSFYVTGSHWRLIKGPRVALGAVGLRPLV